MDNSMVILQNIKNRIILWSSNFTSHYTSQRVESMVFKRYLYTHVHGNIIHTSQKVEATQVSISGWMDTQNACVQWTLFSLKKDVNTDTCHIVDEH